MTSRKVILITGAAKRLGKYLAEGLTSNYDLAIHYHQSAAEAEALAKKLTSQRKKSAFTFKANMMSLSEIEKGISQVLDYFGHIDILINNASIFERTPFGTISEKEWDHHMDINLKGPFFCTQTVARWMLKQKNITAYKIINIADSGSPKTRGDYLPYWISKSGLMAMTETLAKVFAPGIQINSIAPGPILFPEDAERLKKQLCIYPEEILKTVHYLLEASSVTGNTIILDQGRRYLI